MSDPGPEHRACRRAPDDVWEAVRKDYLDGLGGPACSRRHGVSLTALRTRAAREGWRRRDQPWTSPTRADPAIDDRDEGAELEEQVGGDLDRLDYVDLSLVADRRMMRCALRGDAAGALLWRRVRQVLDADQAEIDRLDRLDETQSIQRQSAIGLAEAIELHQLNGASKG